MFFIFSMIFLPFDDFTFQARDLRNLTFLSNPTHLTTRDLLSERYGVALPYIADRRENPDKVRTWSAKEEFQQVFPEFLENPGIVEMFSRA